MVPPLSPVELPAFWLSAVVELAAGAVLSSVPIDAPPAVESVLGVIDGAGVVEVLVVADGVSAGAAGVDAEGSGTDCGVSPILGVDIDCPAPVAELGAAGVLSTGALLLGIFELPIELCGVVEVPLAAGFVVSVFVSFGSKIITTLRPRLKV